MVAMASSTPLQSPPVKGLVIIGNGQAGVGKGV